MQAQIKSTTPTADLLHMGQPLSGQAGGLQLDSQIL